MTLRCPECRTRRATFKTMKLHVAKSQHKLCKCGGYHYPHRPGSPCCEKNTMSPFHLAVRRGESPDVLEDILLDLTLDGKVGRKSTAKEPPF